MTSSTDSDPVSIVSDPGRQVRYGLILAILLVGFFLIGNPIEITPTAVSAFPFLLALLPIPLILFFSLWEKRSLGEDFVVQDGVWFGEKVSRYAGFGFGLFAMGYTVYVFDMATVSFILMSGLIPLLATWVVGVTSAVACALVISYIPPPGEQSTA